MVGSVSKSLATVATYPLIRTKIVMQARKDAPKSPRRPDTRAGRREREEASAPRRAAERGDCVEAEAPRAAAGMGGVLLQIWREQGLAGLFVGCEAQIFTAVAKSGILLTCKEQLVRYTVALVLAFSRRPPALPAPANRG